MATTRIDRVLLTLLGCSLLFNVLPMMAPQLVARMTERPAPVIGRTLPPVTVTSLEGDPVTISYKGQATVLYIMSPTCIWCSRNTENMAAVWKANAGKYRFVALSMTKAGLPDYLSRKPIPFPVYVIESPHDPMWGSYALGATPYTLVVDQNGRVTEALGGAYLNNTQRKAEKLFGMKMPGLTLS